MSALDYWLKRILFYAPLPHPAYWGKAGFCFGIKWNSVLVKNGFYFFPQLELDFVVKLEYRSGTVNSNTVNSKFHLIRSYCEIFIYHFPNISCLKCTFNSNFHLIRSKTLLTKDFKLTVPDLYNHCSPVRSMSMYALPI